MEQTWLEAICYSLLLENTKIFESEQLPFGVMSESWTCTMLSLGYFSSLWVDRTTRDTHVFRAGDILLPRSDCLSPCHQALFWPTSNYLSPFKLYSHSLPEFEKHVASIFLKLVNLILSAENHKNWSSGSCAMLVWEHSGLVKEKYCKLTFFPTKAITSVYLNWNRSHRHFLWSNNLIGRQRERQMHWSPVSNPKPITRATTPNFFQHCWSNINSQVWVLPFWWAWLVKTGFGGEGETGWRRLERSLS